MHFDKDKIKQQVVGHLADWQRLKQAQKEDHAHEPGQSPLSQQDFARHSWKQYLSGIGAGYAGAMCDIYQYLQEQHRDKTEPFEKAIEEVFQELEQQHVITIASPYRRPGGSTMQYGQTVGGKLNHQYELTASAACFASLQLEGLLAVLTIPKGFEHLADRVARFIQDVGQFERNVFLIMPFGTDPDLANAQAALTALLKTMGYNLYRADNKEYEDGLWENICVYMLGCKYGLALFKEIAHIQYNPNVAVEIGFMTAWNKRVLILKDKALPKLPGDLVYRLYHPVDFSDVASVERESQKWFTDL